MSSPRIPPLPQRDAISDKSGNLTLPWNMFFVELLRYIQANSGAISGLSLTGGAGGGGVATAGAEKAVDLTEQASNEGTSNLGARADHLHQMLVQAEDDGASIGNVSALNVRSPYLDVAYEPNLTGSLLTGLYAYWPLDEESGTRYQLIGSGTGCDLVESGGTVSSAAGKFGLSADSSKATTKGLLATISSGDFTTDGFTVAIWTDPYADFAIIPAALFTIWDGVGTYTGGSAFFSIHRFYNSDYLDMQLAMTGGTGLLPAGQKAGPLFTNDWNLVVVAVDAVAKTIHLDINGGNVLTPGQVNWSKDVTFTGPLSNLSPDTFNVGRAFSALDSWHGRNDAAMIWTRALTAAERERLWVSQRASISANPYALEILGGF